MMTGSDVIERLEKEKTMIIKLNGHLKQELLHITNDDVEALEASMPAKYKLLKEIAKNREGLELFSEEQENEYAEEIQAVRKDLTILWKKASSLNELSKSMVGNRLTDIERQLEPFFKGGRRTGYTREGRKSMEFSRLVKTGA